ncbi:MAG TPA: DUF3108 domain-containing protein [Candidatus Binataceae bacterium]|nr:DUF3108 domain-containing protein [Candidatus Binataceae bacterium]
MFRNASNREAKKRRERDRAAHAKLGHGAGLLAAAICALILLRAGSAAPADPAHPRRRHARASVSPTPQALPANIRVPAYRAGAMPFHDGERLFYEASWLGIPAARARFELHRNRKDPDQWKAEAWIETTQVVDVLFKMRDYMAESFAIGSLATTDVYQRQSENRRFDEYSISFDRRSHLVTARKKNPRETEIRQFISGDPWGPISGAMMALTQRLDPGANYEYDVFSGTTRYVFSFHVDGRERIRTPLGVFDAIKIIPGVVYLSNGRYQDEATTTTIWVSADRRRLPLRLQAAAFIGQVTADLTQVDGDARVATR